MQTAAAHMSALWTSHRAAIEGSQPLFSTALQMLSPRDRIASAGGGVGSPATLRRWLNFLSTPDFPYGAATVL